MMKIMLKHLTLWSLCLLLTPAWSAERTTYFHLDLLGSPAAATDSAGQVVWREEYKPYGERTLRQDQNTNALWYTGKVHEEALGLSYYGARWYDPELGRFTGIDPVDVDENNPHSFNRYAYANNNPYKYIDPDGRVVETAVDIVSLGLSIGLFNQDPSIANGLGVAFDGLATVVPFLPGGFGIIKSAGNIADGIGDVTKGTKPLLGKNPKATKTRTNTDLSGDKATAKSIFRNQTKGQKVKDFNLDNDGVRRRAKDGTQIRFNPDGSTRLDLPNRGPNPPGRETIHIGR